MSEDTPAGCWAHYSLLDKPGYRSLDPGEIVDFEWQEADQDGFAYRAVWVRPRHAPPSAEAARLDSPSAYRSCLTITPDQLD